MERGNSYCEYVKGLCNRFAPSWSAFIILLLYKKHCPFPCSCSTLKRFGLRRRCFRGENETLTPQPTVAKDCWLDLHVTIVPDCCLPLMVIHPHPPTASTVQYHGHGLGPGKCSSALHFIANTDSVTGIVAVNAI